MLMVEVNIHCGVLSSVRSSFLITNATIVGITALGVGDQIIDLLVTPHLNSPTPTQTLYPLLYWLKVFCLCYVPPY